MEADVCSGLVRCANLAPFAADSQALAALSPPYVVVGRACHGPEIIDQPSELGSTYRSDGGHKISAAADVLARLTKRGALLGGRVGPVIKVTLTVSSSGILKGTSFPTRIVFVQLISPLPDPVRCSLRATCRRPPTL